MKEFKSLLFAVSLSVQSLMGATPQEQTRCSDYTAQYGYGRQIARGDWESAISHTGRHCTNDPNETCPWTIIFALDETVRVFGRELTIPRFHRGNLKTDTCQAEQVQN